MKKYILFIACNLFNLIFLQAQMNTSAAFEVKVSGQGAPLFLIPGAGCSGEVWNSTVDRFSKEYTCHVFTLAGYGGVPALEEAPYLPVIKKAIIDYIKANSSQDATLIGHSIGGYLALTLGIEHQEEFKKLIIVDGLPFLAAAQNPFATEEMVVQMMTPNLDQYKSQDEAAFIKQQRLILQSMIQSEENIETALKWSLASDKKMLSYSVFEMMSKDLRAELTKVSTPTLVLGCYDGPYDWAPQFTKEMAVETYENQYRHHPNASIKIAEKTRHFIMFDNPDWYFEQLHNFLGSMEE